MIKFSLHCDNGHGFEAWFGKSSDFDDQSARGLVTCPQCGSTAVKKALMAPAVPRRESNQDKAPLVMNPVEAEQMRKVRELVAAIRANSEDVGERFPEEARKIHYGEVDARGIIGKADAEEARALAEEGISFAPLPQLPDEAN